MDALEERRCQVTTLHLEHDWVDCDAFLSVPLFCPGDGVVPRPISPSEVELAGATLDPDLSRGAIEHAVESLALQHGDGLRQWYTEFEAKQLFQQHRKDRLSCSWGWMAYDGATLCRRPVGMALVLPEPRLGETIRFFTTEQSVQHGTVTWTGWGSQGHGFKVRGRRGLVYAHQLLGPDLDDHAVEMRVREMQLERMLDSAASTLRSEQYRFAGEIRNRLIDELPVWVRRGQPIEWVDHDPPVLLDNHNLVRLTLRRMQGISVGRHRAKILKVRVSHRLEVDITVEADGTEWQIDLREMKDLMPLPRSKAEAKRWEADPPSPMPTELPTLPPGFWDEQT